MRRIGLALLCLGLAGPAAGQLQHRIEGPVQPWTGSEPVAGPRQFSFAVFSDLTGSERERIFEIALAQIDLLRPELIIGVGDLIETSDDPQTIARQWEHFERRAAQAGAPVFNVGGNHDLLGEALQAAWVERIGPRYYHFVYRDVLFLVLDTEDHAPERMRELITLRREAYRVAAEQGWEAFGRTEYVRQPENAAGSVSAKQSEYFLRVLAEHAEVRWTFLFLHKAPWLRPELESFTAIERALADRPYTVFHGHEHVFAYRQRFGRDYIQLATTGGVQLPARGRSMDHFLWVTVSDDGVDIANLLMAGVLDKTGHIPLDGDGMCFESVDCPPQP